METLIEIHDLAKVYERGKQKVEVLHHIELDRGYLQEHGRLTGPRCKAITRAVNDLCKQVRGDGEALVDAFGIPDEVLRAPIGRR